MFTILATLTCKKINFHDFQYLSQTDKSYATVLFQRSMLILNIFLVYTRKKSENTYYYFTMRVTPYIYYKVLILYAIIRPSSSSQDIAEFSYDPKSTIGPNEWKFVNVR